MLRGTARRKVERPVGPPAPALSERAADVARWVEVLSLLSGDVTTRDVARAAGLARIDHGIATRIGEALRRAGWRFAYRRGTGIRERVYRREAVGG